MTNAYRQDEQEVEAHSLAIEINCGSRLWAVTFSASGAHVISGHEKEVRVWRAEDGKQVAAIATPSWRVYCLAVSNDGRWMAAGTALGDVVVWDANTHERIFSEQVGGVVDNVIYGVDFSPADSTRFVTASHKGTAIIWDVLHKQALAVLHHNGSVIAARYSQQGDRIATATAHHDSLRIYDSNNCHLLVDIKVNVTPWCYTGFLWSNNQLLIISDGKFKKVEASATSPVVSEFQPVPRADSPSTIALPQHGEFIAYSANCTVSFWDSSTQTHLGRIQHTQEINSMAVSPEDKYLAIGGAGGKITINRLSRLTVGALHMFLGHDASELLYYHSIIQEPEFHVQLDNTTLDPCDLAQLTRVDELLLREITDCANPSYHTLAIRALVRVRLGKWDTALHDAKKSIKIRPSIIGYIAKSVVLVKTGEKDAGYRACDIAFDHCHSTHVTYLLLIKAIIVFIGGEYRDAISRLDDLTAVVRFNSMCCAVQAHMYLLLGDMHTASKNYESAIELFKCARRRMRLFMGSPLFSVSLIFGWKFDDLDIKIQQRLCDALYARGQVNEGVDTLLELVKTFQNEVYASAHVTGWVSNFTHKCLSIPQGSSSDPASMTAASDEATVCNASSALITPTLLLREWVKSTLTRHEWTDALVAAINFTVPRFTIYQAIWEHLERVNYMTGAIMFFQQMNNELRAEMTVHGELAKWAVGRLECLGDTAMEAQQYDDAFSHYTAALSVDPVAHDLFVKRSKVYLVKDLWEDALRDADKAITLDPSSPWGYEAKHAALHKAEDYRNAINAFDIMLLKMSQSADSQTYERLRQYVNPEQTKGEIRSTIRNFISKVPPVLINTDTGRLLNRSEQASSFESWPIFPELVSSMTMHIDHARIKEEVAAYYKYAMFSHKWEDNEPLFERVTQVVVYELEESLAHDKLKMFCKIVREAGFHWAWSDTCCINKADLAVLQEALVSMFKWYEGSAMTIIFLRGVCSLSQRGDLVRSIWNTRAWTLQEYHASQVVQFYTEDWTPYLNLEIPNHKDSPEIVSEMEEATGIPAQALMALRPGLDDIRKKLCLASTRRTSRVEDTAYSLFGIFSVNMPIIYGERENALGRLLATLLANSGDTSILAWTGAPGGFNSCLPADIAVFNEVLASHIPPTIKKPEMDTITDRLRASSLNIALVMEFYEKLGKLDVPWFRDQRMKLPCIIFKLGPLSTCRSGSEYVFRARATVLGTVEIRTKRNLSGMKSLRLIHPWIDYLLDRQPVDGVAQMTPRENTEDQTSAIGGLYLPQNPPKDPPNMISSNASSVALQKPATWFTSGLVGLTFPSGRPASITPDVESLHPPSSVSQTDKQTRAFQIIARLRQPFGALLLASKPENVSAYERVAAENIITVQVQEITPKILNELIRSIGTIDVL